MGKQCFTQRLGSRGLHSLLYNTLHPHQSSNTICFLRSHQNLPLYHSFLSMSSPHLLSIQEGCLPLPYGRPVHEGTHCHTRDDHYEHQQAPHPEGHAKGGLLLEEEEVVEDEEEAATETLVEEMTPEGRATK